ncbi:MAG: tRNA threonylcarbamoyladenosine dehydratase, partial [Lachnospiraceae bacterium]|nr:tRNA threonylcarbamoyladenosine dehydratase [Lachnospiraceae bacterium]
NKLDPGAFRVADIYKTSVCPLARVMRWELRKRGIEHLKVVYSEEVPRTPQMEGEAAAEPSAGRRQTPGSIAFVPPAAGLVLAGEVVRDLLAADNR